MNTAILFLIFNRPIPTEKVFESIRLAKPPRLYIAADGPRKKRIGEKDKCEAARNIIQKIDWDCQVKTLFRESNLGCKLGVSEGITWFFEHEENGIILEDDVVPLPSFFYYCEELLAKYTDDKNILMISGCNPIANFYTSENSYFFSQYVHVWGWASWRRVWNQYDVNMKAWPKWHQAGGLNKFGKGNLAFISYWQEIFEKTYQGQIDTWDYQLIFSCWLNGGLTILPQYNQTLNIGYGPDATHTIGDASKNLFSTPQQLTFPLKHVTRITHNNHADKIISKRVFQITWFSFIKIKIKNSLLYKFIAQKMQTEKKST